MLNGKNSTDKLLLSTNVTVLVAYFFVFQAPIDTDSVKWILLISFVLYICSALMILWFLHRFQIRDELYEVYREKTLNKFSKRIRMFMEEILVPFERLKAKSETLTKLVKVSTEDEYKTLMESIDMEIKELKGGKNTPKAPKEEEATKYVLESFLEQFVVTSKADYNKAFHQPLKERNARIKLKADRITFRFRRHTFTSASVFAIFSIFIEILSK